MTRITERGITFIYIWSPKRENVLGSPLSYSPKYTSRTYLQVVEKNYTKMIGANFNSRITHKYIFRSVCQIKQKGVESIWSFYGNNETSEHLIKGDIISLSLLDYIPLLKELELLPNIIHKNLRSFDKAWRESFRMRTLYIQNCILISKFTTS